VALPFTWFVKLCHWNRFPMFVIGLVMENKIDFHNYCRISPYDMSSKRVHVYVTLSCIPWCVGPCSTTAAEWMATSRKKQTSRVTQFPHLQTPMCTLSLSLTHTLDHPCRLIPANYIEVVPASRSSSQAEQQQSMEDSGGAAAAASAISGSQTPPQQSH
jgi:hypothetical protein